MFHINRARLVSGAGIRYVGQATKTIPLRRRRILPNKHWNPLFAKERAQSRYLKIDLVDHEFERKRSKEQITPEEMKEQMKKMGIEPSIPWNEKPFYISSTGAILDAYVPVEGDGKASLLSKDGAKQGLDKAKGKGKTMSSVRKIRSYEEDFDARTFVDEALEIYIAAHNALANNELDLLHLFDMKGVF